MAQKMMGDFSPDKIMAMGGRKERPASERKRDGGLCVT